MWDCLCAFIASASADGHKKFDVEDGLPKSRTKKHHTYRPRPDLTRSQKQAHVGTKELGGSNLNTHTCTLAQTTPED